MGISLSSLFGRPRSFEESESPLQTADSLRIFYILNFDSSY